MSCVICRGKSGDSELERIEAWENELWRLTIGLQSEVLGFAYLEPKRHVPSIAELDGDEAASFGSVLARVTHALRDLAGAEQVYVYVFGDGVPHLHVHLAPHRAGDALSSQMIRGEMMEENLPSGATRIASKDYPCVPEIEQRTLATRLRDILGSR